LAHPADQEHAGGDAWATSDAESAIKNGVEEFDIKDEHKQRRLVAQLTARQSSSQQIKCWSTDFP
jgi:hypothetical protein